MPLPFILAGAAILAGSYGVKKGIDAKSDYDAAKRWNEKAQDLFNDAQSELETKRELAQQAMQSLGTLKFEIYDHALIPFIDVFSQIKDINFRDAKLTDASHLPRVSKDELDAIKHATLEMKEVVTGGITALGSGGLAGLAAYGGVGLLGTASTGTAIGTLSGAAATNATLAWLGGGSLAAGGYGMAGGMMVLGGIVAGPVLAVGGMMLASKAEAAKEDAWANYDKAELAAEQMKSAGVVTDGITARFIEIENVLGELYQRFIPMLNSLQLLVNENSHYPSWSQADQKGLFVTAATAKALKNLLEAPIMNDDGALSVESENILASTQTLLTQIG
jgi:hypothetical protein